MPHFPLFNPTNLIMNNTTKSALLDKAVSVFKRGEFTDIIAAARKYRASQSILLRRVYRITLSYTHVNSDIYQALIILQEEVLITRINYLSECRLPLMTIIIRNLIEEI